MNMPGVCAPPREYTAPPARERETKKLESDEPVDSDDVETEDTKSAPSTKSDEGTRSVQDLIAAAIKMFAKIEPKAEPVAIQAPAIQLAAAPNIEAAVHQVLDQIVAKPAIKDADEKKTDEPILEGAKTTPDAAIAVEPQAKLDAPMPSKGPVATTAVRDPAPLPENPNPSHMHLVLDDGPQRVVVTVAVRGNEVNATIRGGDEQTASAIARNAASLDHALRAGGLDLSSFSSERDLEHHAPREREQRQHEDEEEMA
jgi:hypothetical protein